MTNDAQFFSAVFVLVEAVKRTSKRESLLTIHMSMSICHVIDQEEEEGMLRPKRIFTLGNKIKL